MIHVFSKPYVFEDEEVKEIEIDLDSLKGSDIEAAKKEFSKEGHFSAILGADPVFCMMLAARLTKRPKEFFDDLPGKDYLAISQEIQNFLLG